MSKKFSQIDDQPIDDDMEDEEEEEEVPKKKKKPNTKKVGLAGRKSKPAKIESAENDMQDDDDEVFDTNQAVDEQNDQQSNQNTKDQLQLDAPQIPAEPNAESKKSLFADNNKPQTKTGMLSKQLSNQPKEITISRGGTLEDQISKVKENQEPVAKTTSQNGEKGSLADRLAKFKMQPVREYYEEKLTPILLEGLKEVGRQRPDNPVKFLGEYLINFNAKN